jgi:hypothetical protein
MIQLTLLLLITCACISYSNNIIDNNDNNIIDNKFKSINDNNVTDHNIPDNKLISINDNNIKLLQDGNISLSENFNKCGIRYNSTTNINRPLKILISTNEKYIPLFLNWLIYYNQICPDRSNLYILCLDKATGSLK